MKELPYRYQGKVFRSVRKITRCCVAACRLGVGKLAALEELISFRERLQMVGLAKPVDRRHVN
jgi:hypothetical protein